MWIRPTEVPCMFCEDRTVEPNCHSTCSAYADFRKRVEQLNKIEDLENAVNYYNAPMRANQKDYYAKKKKEGSLKK